MKSTTVVMALAASTVALPSAYEVKPIDELSSNTPLGTMKWIGPLSPDSNTTTTLYGTAESIYRQILSLNPSYSPWDFGDFRAEMAAKGITRDTMEARSNAKQALQSPNPAAAVLKRDPEWFDCNAGSWVWFEHCNEPLDTMRRLGGGGAQCAVEGGKCTRFACAWTCGLYLCSRTGGYVAVECAGIARDAERISRTCSYWDFHGLQARGRLVYDHHYSEVTKQDC
ncbi:hypothetical protein B0T14DRAFT_136366 [Immersiella caudata]|uniref:Uncharacterized protein n=1 Tax=Immersiella caudata TaxID=314043 RepID=A0AA39X5A3_9PEZI|nr:hypothetical protein B0T14DRAFT_136366 [Immersiella caudata]